MCIIHPLLFRKGPNNFLLIRTNLRITGFLVSHTLFNIVVIRLCRDHLSVQNPPLRCSTRFPSPPLLRENSSFLLSWSGPIKSNVVTVGLKRWEKSPLNRPFCCSMCLETARILLTLPKEGNELTFFPRLILSPHSAPSSPSAAMSPRSCSARPLYRGAQNQAFSAK